MLIYDLVDPQELIGFARALQFDQFRLDQWLPNRNIVDIEYRFRRGNLSDQDAAAFRAWDTEAPIAARQGAQRVSGELPPISRKIRLGEEERLRLNALQSGNNDAIVEQIFADTRNMIRAVQARIELARGQVLSTGRLTLNENGLVAVVDFGVPAENFVTAPTVWSDPDADILGDAETWGSGYETVTDGLRPGVGVTSTRVINQLIRNAGFRQLASTLVGTPSLVTQQMVQQIFAAHGIPPLVANDTRVRVDGVAQRVIPEDVIVWLPPAGETLGQTLYGVTAEALELAGEGLIDATDTPGVVAVVEKTTDPVATWTLGTGISLPVLANPELLMVSTVL